MLPWTHRIIGFGDDALYKSTFYITLRYIPNGILIGSAIFAQLMADSPYMLLFPLKIAPSAWVSESPSNTQFLGPT